MTEIDSLKLNKLKVRKIGSFLLLGLVVVLGVIVGRQLIARYKNEAEKSEVCFSMMQCVTVYVADTHQGRYKGLSGRESMAENEGMLFVYDEPGDYGYVMRGMKFGLDFVWVKRVDSAGEAEVVDITENVLAPKRVEDERIIYKPMAPVDMVLEVNQGFVERNNIRIGDKFQFNLD